MIRDIKREVFLKIHQSLIIPFSTSDEKCIFSLQYITCNDISCFGTPYRFHGWELDAVLPFTSHEKELLIKLKTGMKVFWVGTDNLVFIGMCKQWPFPSFKTILYHVVSPPNNLLHNAHLLTINQLNSVPNALNQITSTISHISTYMCIFFLFILIWHFNFKE